MKQKFEVTIARTEYKTYNVEAETEEEAIAIMQSRIKFPCKVEYGYDEILINEFLVE